MARLATILIILLMASWAHAYDGEPKEQVAAFFKDYSAGKQAVAIDKLYSKNPLSGQRAEQLTLMKQRAGSVQALYGSFLGTENIHTEALSPSLVRIVELARHERHPVLWEFYFYKSKNQWFAAQVMFEDQFQVAGAKK
ncbi:conserved exported hypothetical protein [Candidatus Desulfarcum epimagneticum]|uniref:DUF3887 domain-containing protein n=1 Tax=uncultured Desulfobacteraceae bacterium TaxID=218296 RepID=A0A484HG29_9BACT|nr:conserved exported hypothetical protein [uncultured Desulfobacteraceae bacterium]